MPTWTLLLLAWMCVAMTASAAEKQPESLPGTHPLTESGDLASHLVEGADRFLLRELERSTARRAGYWERDFSSPAAYQASLEPNRKALAHILGVRDARVPFAAPELVATTAQPALIGHGKGYEVFAIRWPAFGDVHGEGLLLQPTGKPRAQVVALPDADQTPEQLAGLTEGTPAEAQFARRLAESGCRVVVPVLIDRHREKRNGSANLTSREFLYRSAFELGRHLVGYEVQKTLAAVDWFHKDDEKLPIGVMGWGEGGMLALYAAALDTRIDAACVSGFFDDRAHAWEEPIDRNVFGLLKQFGGAELAAMIAPRALVVEAARGPELTLTGEGGAPARLVTPDPQIVRKEVERARSLVRELQPTTILELVQSADGHGSAGSREALSTFLANLAPGTKLTAGGQAPKGQGRLPDAAARQARQMHELDRHTQWLLTESPYVRQEFMKRLDTSSVPAYEKSAAEYRRIFYNDVIGRFDEPVLPPHPRSRKAYDTPKYTGYEVTLEVFPDVMAYGILLLPKDLKPGEKRPVVVCQHGLEGRPQDTVQEDVPGFQYYKAFAAKLAEQGFITFAPQNLYLFTDRFRTLQRKANPLGKTLFSLITPQHQQIVDWLKTLPNVDPQRIAFYGLSYGGKTAMRVPALVTDYCLSICSADFNEWVWKNASTRSPYSYVWGGEYEIFEWDLGSTFNYAEMAALIAPRPFMVERGHFDGVAPDETVAYEFAKVRFLYAAKLGLGDRCEMETFVGPHTINGKGTFEFLRKHLDWHK